jgi:hypothetical protein
MEGVEVNSMAPSRKKEVNEDAVLNVLLYLNVEDVKAGNREYLDDIIDRLGSIYASEGGYERYLDKHPDGSQSDFKDRQRKYQILENASN